MKGHSTQDSLRKHVDARVDKYYPASEYPTHGGGVMPELREMVKASDESTGKPRPAESAFDMKQSTMPDGATMEVEQLFQGVRPLLVVDEASVDHAIPQEMQTEYALGEIATTDIVMSNTFEDQWVSQYLSRIFPWVLNYSCGGAEYPGLFNMEAWEALARADTDPAAFGVEARWRRLKNAPFVTPGVHAQHLATRSEAQVGADWMCVPAARNLHWRYAVLRSAFVSCKEKVAAGESLDVNLQALIDAATSLFQRLQRGSIKVHGRPLPINGDVALLFRADDLTTAERVILKSYLNITKSIAGCQAVRRRIGHCLVGFRVVYGECIFVTVSPSRRWSHMIMRLSRIRQNDPMVDPTLRRERKHVASRRVHAGSSSPLLFTDIESDVDLHYLVIGLCGDVAS